MRSTTPMRAAIRRHEAADLRQQRDQRGLAQEGALAAHVRAGDDLHRGLRRQRRVVGHEGFVGQRQLDDGMAPGDDLDAGAVVHLRAHVAAHQRDFAQRGEDIQFGQRVRQLQQLDAVRRHLRAHLAKDALLDLQPALVGVEHQRLVLLEVGRDVALAVGDRLFADVVGGTLSTLADLVTSM
jgi:hypothetical protein